MTETYGTSQAPLTAPGTPHDTFSSNINERSGPENIMNCNTSISTPSTPENANNTNTNTNREVNVNNVNLFEEKCEALIGSKVPLEIKAWLQDIGRETGETVSQIVRRILTAAYHGQRAISQFQTPTVILNYNVAKAESKPFINVGEYLLMNEIDELLKKGRKLKERAERETQLSGSPLTFTVEQAKKLEEALIKSLRNVKHLPPEKFREVEAALTILRSIREGPK